MASHGVMASGVTSKLLTHEVGAGAPCLNCGDKCPGLDLHFWRKICKNCKCKQESHDVTASVSNRGMDNIERLLQQGSGGSTFKTPPPAGRKSSGAPPPAPKPKQNPTQDLRNQVEEKQRNGNIKKDPVNQIVHPVETPKEKTDIETKDEPFPEPPILTKDEKDEVEEPPSPPPSLSDVNAANNDLTPSKETLFEELEKTFSASSLAEEPTNEPASHASDFSQELNNGSVSDSRPFPPEKIPTSDQLSPVSFPPPRHDPNSKEYLCRDEVVISCLSSENEEEEYEWAPPVSDETLIQKYMKSLPKEKQPIAGTEGAKYRKKQLMRQLPPHDQEPKECHDLTPQETTEMQLFVKQYRQKSLGVAKLVEEKSTKICAECKKPINPGDPLIQAERAGDDKFWHPACFICIECKELLVDLIYFYNEDKIYCGRHYCELHKPRCAACDELIFAPEYTQAEDSYWHLKHFCCWHCDQPLGGKNYVPHENQPICIPCYEKTFAHTCATCKQIIAPNTEWVTFEKFHWHARAACFKCIQCNQSLVGKPCIPKGEKVFCSSRCKREWLSTPEK